MSNLVLLAQSNGGEWWTRGAIWLAVAAYFLALADLAAPSRWRLARRLWTLACVLSLAHIALALHFYHGWSHAAALADTARQTREVVGFDWRGGIYFNYLFAALWIVDAAWWWLAPASRAARPRWVSFAIHGYLAFIVINATIVFEDGVLRWLAVAASVIVLAILMRSRRVM